MLCVCSMSHWFFKCHGLSKTQNTFSQHFSLFFSPYVFREKFNSYVSDLFTCKSSECCFVRTIWCPGSLLSLSFEVPPPPPPRIRKLWFTKKKRKKKHIRTPNIFSSKVQILFKRWMASSLSLILQLAVCIFLLLIDTTLLDVSNVFLVDIKVHICSVWPRTDPKKRRWALQRWSECIL